MQICPIFLSNPQRLCPDCIKQDCAMWVDDRIVEKIPEELRWQQGDKFKVKECHHCGLIGRVWGRDDR